MSSETKMIVFDLDGTLLNSQKVMNESSIDAIRNVISLGHKVCIATGRTINENVKDIINTLGLQDYTINVNGNFIYDIKNQKIESCGKPIPKNIVNIFKEKAIEIKRQFNVYNSSGEVKRFYFGINEKEEIQDPEYFSNGIVCDKFDDISELNNFLNDPEKPIVHMGLKAEVKTIEKIFEDFQNNKQMQDIHLSLCSKVYVLADSYDVNKWNAILSIAERLNIKEENIYAFGDSGNDFEMLINSKHGYCMGNANESFKKHFNKNQIIGDHDSDAISETLTREFNL